MTEHFYVPKPPEYGVGSDGNYIVVGDLVRHNSDDLDVREGKAPGPPGTVESLSLRYLNTGEAEVWAKVRWPKNPGDWPRPPGGGSIEARADTFRKLTRGEQLAEMFMLDK